ncbi:MAG: diheme cytochrome c [Burkholderiaceae bacterium]
MNPNTWGTGGRWRTALGAGLLGMAVATVGVVRADDDHERRARAVSAMPAEVAEECGACHLAYPAYLLPAPSWQRIMTGLADHYGSDASLDPAQAARITDWLMANARAARRGDPPPQDRITRSRAFVHEHDEIDADVWRHPSVGSPANCGACHADVAARGFDEHDIVMPPGLNARQRRSLRD